MESISIVKFKKIEKTVHSGKKEGGKKKGGLVYRYLNGTITETQF